MRAISSTLCSARRTKKMSLRQAADQIGISHTYLACLEKGKDSRTGKDIMPTPRILKKLAGAYSLDYGELLLMCRYIEPQEPETGDEYNVIVQNIQKLKKVNPKGFAEVMKSIADFTDGKDEQ